MKLDRGHVHTDRSTDVDQIDTTEEHSSLDCPKCRSVDTTVWSIKNTRVCRQCSWTWKTDER